MEATISLRQYLGKGKTFVIPEYQRGYIWGKRRADGGTDSVTYLMSDLLAKFKAGILCFCKE